jgi:hypothetical protein
MASPNEFMIDAATRRYYGTPFFENLQAAAKQGFQRIKQGDESFFRDDELEVEQEAQKMQEGGEVKDIPDREIPQPVGGGFGGYGGTGPMFTGFEFKTYVHATKPEIQIVFFNGRPLSPIPEGYTLKAGTPVEQQKQKQEVDDNDNDGGSGIEPPKTWRNTDPSDWSMNDFKTYVSDTSKKDSKDVGKLTLVEKAVLHLVGNVIIPGGGFALTKLADRETKNKTNLINNQINNMLKSGKDKDGKDLTEQTNNILFRSQYFANLASSNIDPTGQSQGTPIFDQSFYKGGEDDPSRPPMFATVPGKDGEPTQIKLDPDLDVDKLLPSPDIIDKVFGSDKDDEEDDVVDNPNVN